MADLIFKLVVSEDGKDVFTTPLSYEMVSAITFHYPDTSESDNYFTLASKHAASSVRESVAQKASLGPDVVAALSKDASIDVLRSLVASDGFRKYASQDLLEKLIELDAKIADTIVSCLWSYKEADANRLVSLLAAIADPAVVVALARSCSTPSKVLKSLVNHPDLLVASEARRTLRDR